MQGVTLITNSDFQRLHMKTMKYLASSADMPVSEQVYTLLFALIVELGLAWWSIKNSIH
jgi:hypothetical protein